MAKQYLMFFICSVFGQLVHLLIKANSMQKRANASGIEFKAQEQLFKKDWTSIALSFCCNLLLLMLYPEISRNYTSIQDWSMCLFALSGYTGSSLVLSILSKADKQLQSTIKTKLTSKMEQEYIWEVEFENSTDKVDFESTQYSISEFAQMTGGEFSTMKIIYTEEPSFSELNCIRLDTTTYLAVPIRKPK